MHHHHRTFFFFVFFFLILFDFLLSKNLTKLNRKMQKSAKIIQIDVMWCARLSWKYCRGKCVCSWWFCALEKGREWTKQTATPFIILSVCVSCAFFFYTQITLSHTVEPFNCHLTFVIHTYIYNLHHQLFIMYIQNAIEKTPAQNCSQMEQ